MDNFYIDVTAHGKWSLKSSLDICLEHSFKHSLRTAVGYREVKVTEIHPYLSSAGSLSLLHLLDKDDPAQVQFTEPLVLSQLTGFVQEWLDAQTYPPYPTSVTNIYARGFRVINTYERGLLCQVQPVWAIYGGK